ncbi:MAG: hypothetical protein AMJ78_00215 [Omnitrophica WOR_2 bacterium SM23_29]|nr:MAG: hypothetical protein AMJ78_00215 [Omnitrophica WOR_2 bacterium SM23_29]
MFFNKTFIIALTISLITHAAIFIKLPHLNLFSKRQAQKRIEVTYIKERAKSASLDTYTQKFPKKPSHQVSSKSVAPPPQIKKEQIFSKLDNIPIRKPKVTWPEIVAMKKKITMPSLSEKKMTNPVYLSYYQIIREKIKRAAYENYTRLVNGEVYLSFIILNDGQLKEERINERKSSPHSYLKEIAIKSIYDASPFPSFPKELDYPELSFNVIISFEVE